MGDLLAFSPCAPARWRGRFRRLSGSEGVFHLWKIAVGWWPGLQWRRGEEIACCLAYEQSGVEALGEAVNSAKSFLKAPPGGSFLINENGQVLVPAGEGSSHCAYVGRIKGKLLFAGPEGETIDLYDASGRKPGDRWPLPYIGMPYALSADDRIYFERHEEKGIRRDPLVRPDPELVAALRRIKPSGPLLFLVNPGGLVLAKRPALRREGGSGHVPVFVGLLRREAWFPAEGRF